MRMEGRIRIAAPRDRAYAALTDPGQVAACLPGSPAVEAVDGHFRAPAVIRAGFIRATAMVDVTLVTADPPDAATFEMAAAISGGTVRTLVSLDFLGADRDGRDGTEVRWTADVTIKGALGAFGGAIVGAARTQAEQTLECLKARLEIEAARRDPSGA